MKMTACALFTRVEEGLIYEELEDEDEELSLLLESELCFDFGGSFIGLDSSSYVLFFLISECAS